MKRFLLILALLVSGCSTTQTMPTDEPFSNMSSARSPLQKLSKAIGYFGRGVVTAQAEKDFHKTLDWANGLDPANPPPSDPLRKARALACPTMGLLVNDSVRNTVVKIQEEINSFDATLMGIVEGDGFYPVYELSKLRYGDPGSKSDHRANLSKLRDILREQITGFIDECRGVFPLKQTEQLIGAVGGMMLPIPPILKQ